MTAPIPPAGPAAGAALPRALPPGGTIALVAPAGSVPVDDQGRLHPKLAAGLERLQAAGYRTVFGRHVFARHGYLAGDDSGRLADLRWALTDPGIDAVICVRGGYGSPRLLEQADFAPLARDFARRPRPLVGFSDLTALLAALTAVTGIPTFHGPTLGSLDEPANLEALLRLIGRDARFPQQVVPMAAPGAPRPRTLRSGRAEGRLVGGNLSLLCALVGTPYEPDPRGAVLLLEDVGEPPYRLDRMLTHLRLAGWLRQVAGIIVGELVDCDPPAGRPSFTAAEVLEERLGDLGVPCLVDVPCGHGRWQLTLPLGARVALDAGAGTVTVLEPVTA